MPTARLHDGSALDVAVRGGGPALLLPVATTTMDDAAAAELRAWGGEPDLGRTLAEGCAAAGFRVLTADYEGHLAAHPRLLTLSAATVAGDLLAIADAAGAQRFAYYGYSWLALAGLHLATRTDRLTALAMGGFPPLEAPYAAMLAVTRAAHREALAQAAAADEEQPAAPVADVEPGDWDSATMTQTPDQTRQYLTLYESLQGFDERAALERLTLPRLVLAGADDNITYGPRWGDTRVVIADAVAAHREELTERGWTVHLVPDADHLAAMASGTVLPILAPWLQANAT